MSSSKIQERNLDPNMGLAKQGTSEEILEKMEQGVTAELKVPVSAQVFKGSTSNDSFTAVTAVNVSGKGVADFNVNGISSHSRVEIVVDGVVVVGNASTSIADMGCYKSGDNDVRNFIIPFSESFKATVVNINNQYTTTVASGIIWFY